MVFLNTNATPRSKNKRRSLQSRCTGIIGECNLKSSFNSFGGTARDFRFGTSTGNVAGIFAMSSKQSRRCFRCRPSFPLKYAQRHKCDDFLNMRFFGCLMLSLLNHAVSLAHGWKLTCETCQGFLPGVSIPPSKATVWKVINSTRVVKPSKHSSHKLALS